MSIREWSISRVLVVSILWAVAVLLLVGWRAFNAIRGASGSGAIVGISAGVADLLKLAALILAPPLALVVTWMLQRR